VPSRRAVARLDDQDQLDGQEQPAGRTATSVVRSSADMRIGAGRISEDPAGPDSGPVVLRRQAAWVAATAGWLAGRGGVGAGPRQDLRSTLSMNPGRISALGGSTMPAARM